MSIPALYEKRKDLRLIDVQALSLSDPNSGSHVECIVCAVNETKTLECQYNAISSMGGHVPACASPITSARKF